MNQQINTKTQLDPKPTLITSPTQSDPLPFENQPSPIPSHLHPPNPTLTHQNLSKNQTTNHTILNLHHLQKNKVIEGTTETADDDVTTTNNVKDLWEDFTSRFSDGSASSPWWHQGRDQRNRKGKNKKKHKEKNRKISPPLARNDRVSPPTQTFSFANSLENDHRIMGGGEEEIDKLVSIGEAIGVTFNSKEEAIKKFAELEERDKIAHQQGMRANESIL
jgi:hypothetical protein